MRQTKLLFLTLAMVASVSGLNAATNDKAPKLDGEWDSTQGKLWFIVQDDIILGFSEFDGGRFFVGSPRTDTSDQWDFAIRGVGGKKGTGHLGFVANKTFKGELTFDEGDNKAWTGKKSKDKLPPPPTKAAIGAKWTPEAQSDSMYIELKQNGNFAFGTLYQDDMESEDTAYIVFANIKNQWYWLMYGSKGAITAHETDNLLDIVGEADFDGKLLTLVPVFGSDLEEDPEPLVLIRK